MKQSFNIATILPRDSPSVLDFICVSLCLSTSLIDEICVTLCAMFTTDTDAGKEVSLTAMRECILQTLQTQYFATN